MNYSTMTRKELEAAEVTPGLIEEVSRRVWEAQGKCIAHDWRFDRDEAYPFQAYVHKCAKCNLEVKVYGSAKPPEPHQIELPNITDPAVFCPIFEANERMDSVTRQRKGFVISVIPKHGPRYPVYGRLFGFAVGFAFLRIKEEK